MLNILSGHVRRKALLLQRRQRDVLMLPAADRYFDQVQIWLSHPLSRRQIGQLLQLNRNPDPERGTIHEHNRPMKWQPRWRQRLQIRQVRHATLLALADMVGKEPHLINQVELASDHGYSGDWAINDRDAAFEALNEGWIRKWHRSDHGVRLVRDNGEVNPRQKNHEEGAVTRYDGPEGANNRTAVYGEKHCRNTGEECGLHLEWRGMRAATCERLGIVTIKQLIDFDHDAFWSEKLSHVYQLKPGELGRRLRNRRNRTRSQIERMISFVPGIRFSVDARHGEVIRIAAGSVQRVVDEFGWQLVQQCVQRVNVQVDSV